VTTGSPNRDLVRSIYADWERGDFRDTGWADPGLEFVIAGGLVSSSVTRGLEATGSTWREFLADWQDFRALAEEYRELDDERVLVFHHFGGRGRRSGADVGPTESRGATLFHVLDGRVTKLVLYPLREDALNDLGLAE
jgi:ketosteroid isomerase-like protein